MTPVKFPQQNCTVGENQPKYLPLPAFFDGKAMVTAWQMDEQERKEFLRTGRIYLTQQGTVAPPFINTLLAVRAGLLKRNFEYETKSKIQMER